MSTFSEYYFLNKSQPELDFVDINLEKDQPLFIDPYAIAMRNDEWSRRCNYHIVSFFQTVINKIRSGDHEYVKKILDQLHEPNETCLGLSTNYFIYYAGLLARLRYQGSLEILIKYIKIINFTYISLSNIFFIVAKQFLMRKCCEYIESFARPKFLMCCLH